jgi:methylenetetrahydrofolate reductase (NADPH)
LLRHVAQHLRQAVGPESREQLRVRLQTSLESHVDRALYKCQACGRCLLFETAFICPLTCTRSLRNGPCRGSNPDHCCVDPARACVWFRIYAKSERQGTLDRLLEVNAPPDLRCRGPGPPPSAHGLGRQQGHGPRLTDMITDRGRYYSDWEAYHSRQCQLPWWQGDSRYHAPGYGEPASRMESRLREGRFVVSAEVAPPMDASGCRIAQLAEQLEGCVDTLNFTDNPRGVARMSGLSCAIHSLAGGMEPVLQIQTRHRGRYDLESEVIGACAVGVHSILCLCDDAGRLGPGPRPPAGPSDLDAIQALWMLRRLRDEGVNIDGLAIEHRPSYFLGAIASPCATLPRYAALITEKKINAGAQFLQTMPVFDLGRFQDWMEALYKRDLLGKVYLMVAVAVLKSASHARFLANEVPGVTVPPVIRARVENAHDPREEGVQVALETIAELKRMRWIHGLHIHVPEQEEVILRLVEEAGLKDFAPQVEAASGNGRKKSSSDHSAATDMSRIASAPW